MESHRTYPCRKEVPWRLLEGEALVVDVKAGLLYPLNSVGARIWQLSDGQRTVEEIVGILTGEFDAGEETIREDAIHFLEALVQATLLSLENRARPPSAVGAGTRPHDTQG
ncbi:MAG TPA: PqqD family protein [Candidatus Methylomirabilis sp.]|nr:PqqD family protein [Candidatus Methylomirabilis sp.]HSC70107.1 PqqD family protein [Candidatus Methylomirabilis sp.]